MNKQVEQIEAEIERWKKELRLSTSCEAKYRREMLDDISEFIDLLQEDPVSGDLEEAADLYYEEYCPYEGEAKVVNNIHDVYFPSQAIEDAFIAGANWQKEQNNVCYEEAFEDGCKWYKEKMLKDAVDADAVFDYYDNQDRLYVSILATDVLARKYGLKDRDKVKIIIVKEEEK